MPLGASWSSFATRWSGSSRLLELEDIAVAVFLKNAGKKKMIARYANLEVL
jgi:hypothetical protein